MASERKKIGFIGLGLMGQGFTKRLCACGHQVHGFDLVPEKRAAASRHGVVPEGSAKAVADASDIVHICVMTKTDLEAAVFGEDGVAAAGSPGKILIDHSTMPAEVTKAFAARLLDDTGMAWIDAPVSGGPPAAEAGTLAIMAGGDDAVVARAMSVLGDLGEATHMGATGAGQVTKMVNQIFVLNNFCILAEALALAEAGGVDATKIPSALGKGYAGSNMLEKIFPRMIARDYAPAGYLFQCMKDLDMV
ncbi:MAG: NAD(P)-dependent oxidoreductase, partial [Alphaproteobacteria bacterium]|nr:NAD(P)-dependent oxidoreductase [Alphaproteobacteria bacterium]